MGIDYSLRLREAHVIRQNIEYNFLHYSGTDDRKFGIF